MNGALTANEVQKKYSKVRAEESMIVLLQNLDMHKNFDGNPWIFKYVCYVIFNLCFSLSFHIVSSDANASPWC
jgi:hypothetical protein